MKKPGKLLLLRRAAIGAAMTMAALAGGLSAPGAAMADIPTEYVNYLRVHGTNNCLAYDATKALVAKCGSKNTKWKFDKVTNGSFRLQTYDGFKCLNASYSSINLRDCSDSPNQPGMRWSIIGHGSRTWAEISNYATSDYINAGQAGGVHMTSGRNGEVTQWEWVPADGLEVRNSGPQASVVGTAIPPVNHPTLDGKAPYTWSATGLPPGLSINAKTGAISGTPTTAGSFTVKVVATDSTSLPRSGSTSYSWMVSPVPTAGCSGTNDTDVAIPEFQIPPVESYIAIQGCPGKASATATVEVHIIHPRISDLEVMLVSADGSRTIVLHNQTGGYTEDLHKSFTENLSFSVADGTWRLRVRDRASGNVGRIDRWSIRL
ncbi:putative Ig domain-containing protein [Nonomuraea sp. NPDC049129]|uniref:putative Ig domain-containing protein n=1 Tax=Nonomuraea sp. NPDC049129 TaxID=3155272 RepID=UPI00340E1610